MYFLTLYYYFFSFIIITIWKIWKCIPSNILNVFELLLWKHSAKVNISTVATDPVFTCWPIKSILSTLQQTILFLQIMNELLFQTATKFWWCLQMFFVSKVVRKIRNLCLRLMLKWKGKVQKENMVFPDWNRNECP